MSEPGSEEPTPERLVLFTDAVAAIALTLLVLPLVETVATESRRYALGDLLSEHLDEIGAFVLSFAVIFRFWWEHHRVFGHVATMRMPLVLWSAVWIFSIVLLPIPTALITDYSPSAATVAMYGGVLLLTSGSMTMLAVQIYRHPDVSEKRPRMSRDELLNAVTGFATQLVATVVGGIFADTINYWAFLLMFLTSPVERVVKARWRRQDAATPPP